MTETAEADAMPYPQPPASSHPGAIAQRRRPLALTLVAAVLAAGAASGAARAEPPAVVPAHSMGERLARENCGGCHALQAGVRSSLPDAPSLPRLRAVYDRTAMAGIIDTRMVQIHPRMPPLRLDPDEVAEFLRYWDGLPPVTPVGSRVSPRP